MNETIAVIGLGYVGLPVALAFARRYTGTIGFDLNTTKIAALREGLDVTGEVSLQALQETSLKLTADARDLAAATFFVVAVPTPIDAANRPDLSPLERACELIGPQLQSGAVVVFESTVYPGVTEDVCGPLLERHSGLVRGKDFKLGYSPERINPGDKEHSFERIVKVVSGEDAETLARVATVYEKVVDAGVYRAASIKVAEAAKVIENTQRDLNIALMNELALIFDRLGIRTRDVLAAARTKWNFLPFTPGLVGGHCIGVDPYYLTSKAEELGYHPQVILAGRHINDGMGPFIAHKLIKALGQSDVPLRKARVGILGLAFKENVPDIRNSRVPDIVKELIQFGVNPLVHDALVESEHTTHEYGISLSSLEAFRDLDGLVLAVPHAAYMALPLSELVSWLRPGGILIDIKSVLDEGSIPAGYSYWSL
jgi:UDP-N-acetyl-D-galactosamine dehydrogenase